MTVDTAVTRAPAAAGRVPSRTRVRVLRAGAVLGATAAATTSWVLNVPIAGADLVVRSGTGTAEVEPAAVLLTALGAGLAAWALLAILERAGPRARRAWPAVAVGVLALSLAGPLTAGIDWPTRLALAGLHLSVGVVLIPALWRSTRRC